MNLFEQQANEFLPRHIGPNAKEREKMLRTIGEPDIDTLIDKTVPANIRIKNLLNIPGAMSEHEYLAHIKEVSLRNKVYRNFIGQGYYEALVPSVILRNVFEDPGWYTQYTPYQAEISQGRLEALLNFQTMVADLTGLPLANSSLLDEATAAAEAMAMCRNASSAKTNRFFVAEDVHPQTRAVIRTRALPQGIEVVEGPAEQAAQV